ncbi:MAG: helix-turn-helix domain-containing protein [Prevotellaceae bacterium]|nr:helix-turn-helix domain-containing protein [Prevotellaceae bacterium]
MNDEINIGKLIHEQLKKDGRKVSWLAKEIYCDRSHLYRIFKQNSIDTGLLMRISNALNCDFFALLSSYYKKTGNQEPNMLEITD